MLLHIVIGIWLSVCFAGLVRNQQVFRYRSRLISRIGDVTSLIVTDPKRNNHDLRFMDFWRKFDKVSYGRMIGWFGIIPDFRDLDSYYPSLLADLEREEKKYGLR